MITVNAIISQLLVTARGKFTMLNTTTDLDQEHNCNEDPFLMILKAQDTIMVTTFIMMTPGEGNSHFQPLPSLA